MTQSILKATAQSVAVPASIKPQSPSQLPPQPQLPPQLVGIPPVPLGDHVYQLIKKQFAHMMQEEAAVLRDRDPEPLHQMRVNARRLRSTMELFESVVVMPKGYRLKHLQKFNRTLGDLRNLDVVIAPLKTDYYAKLPSDEQKYLKRCLKRLNQQRRAALKSVKQVLATQSFSQQYKKWLKHPQYNNIAKRSLNTVLPHLLMPELSRFLVHPGWSIAGDALNATNQLDLHDLRKVGKHVRYQLEGIKAWCSQDGADWIESFKALQDCLGTLQDLSVLRQVIEQTLPQGIRSLPQLDMIFQQQQAATLATWDQLRQPYQQSQYHYQCYQWVLQSLKS
jgi:CHAD domain-containing protein